MTAPTGVGVISYVASNTVIRDRVVPVEVRSDGTAKLTVSAGGPAIPLTELPASMLDLLEKGGSRPNPEELVLVVQTSKGPAYKIDALLFGDCEAVDAAFRTFPDPQYGGLCLTDDGRTERR